MPIASVTILTYERPEILRRNLEALAPSRKRLREVIVVDNGASDASARMIAADFPWVRHVHNPVNAGVAGRNLGMATATGDVVVTLDDDVIGLEPADVDHLLDRFVADPGLGAVCFKVLHHRTGEISNWCHHRRAEVDGDARFATYEISEGAVAYRRAAFLAAGGYCEAFFISHEGKDLAYRIMNEGYSVEYDGRVAVVHHHDPAGRPNWRRYYYDTRNAFWLAVRNLPPGDACRFLALTLASMGVYSLRDGFLGTYFRAIRDGMTGMPAMRRTRRPWTDRTRETCRAIDALAPGFWYKLKLRLFRKGIAI